MSTQLIVVVVANIRTTSNPTTTMAYCFTDPRLVRISSDKISSDIYSIENLISTDEHRRRKGYMAEYYIRPPVSIIIDFTAYNFDFMSMKLGLHLREHKTNKIQVFFVGNDGGKMEETMVAFKTTTESSLVISNPFYRPHPSLSPVVDIDCVHHPYTISGRLARQCNNISKIIIKILGTLNSSVPCLSFLQIYGKPHLARLQDMTRFLEQFQVRTPTASNINETKSNTSTSELEQKAPPEFYDPITHELMSMPYLLPSGMTVDKTTLDRCFDNATKVQMDPFTRLPLICDMQPTLNAKLKARIDAYFMTNGRSEIELLNEFRRKLLQ